MLGVGLLAALAFFVVRGAERRGPGRSARSDTLAGGRAAEASEARAAEPASPALDAPGAEPTNAAEAREVLPATAQPLPQESGTARILGRVLAPLDLESRNDLPFDHTRVLATIYPGAGSDAAANIVRQLEFVDAEGRFTFEDMPDGREIELEISPPAGAEQRVHLAPLAVGEQRGVEVRLERGAVVRGRVVDLAGEPVPEVEVRLEDLRPGDLRLLELDELASALHCRTDADGAFEFTELARGPWALSVSAVPVPPHAIELDTSRGDHLDVQVTLEPGLTLEILTRTVDGTPIDCDLQLQPAMGRQEHVATGRYRMVGVPAFLRGISAEAFTEDQFLRAEVRDVLVGPAPLELVLESLDLVDLQAGLFDPPREWSLFEPRRGTAVLAGRVEDARGRPANGATVTVRQGDDSRSASTNRRGEFLVERLSSGTTEVLLVAPDSGALLRVGVELVDDARTCLEARFEPLDPAPVTLRFRADGRPSAGRLTLQGERGHLRRTVDASGRLALELPYPGRYAGRFEPVGAGEPKHIELDAPAHVELEFRLEDLPLAEMPR